MRIPSEPQRSLRIVNRTQEELQIHLDGGQASLCIAGEEVSLLGKAYGIIDITPVLEGRTLSLASRFQHDGKVGKLCNVNASSAFNVFHLDTPTPTLTIFAQRNLARWMSDIPDDTSLGELCIPGTHDSCSLYGYPISQCQQASTPPDVQLQNGVRFLDIRMKVVGSELKAYHGPRPQRSTFLTLISQISAFLSANPTETLIILMKEEANGTDQDPRFSRILHKNLLPQIQAGHWFLENRIPRLGEVRGKAILLSRFDLKEGDGWVGEDGIGIHPSTWPDSARQGFEWDCAGTTFRTQDWYRLFTVLEIPEKFEAINTHISSNTPRPTQSFTLSYTSAAGFPFALPTHIAKGFGWPAIGLGIEGVNARLARYLLECAADGTRIKACFASDFFGEVGGLNELIVAMNFIEASAKMG